MRTKKVNRYYCDHCNKGGFKKKGMAEHELACIKNPTRAHCWLCAQVPQAVTPMSELKTAFETGTGLGNLREAANGCPACMLAAMIQYQEGYPYDFEFDYKKEKASFLDELRPKYNMEHW